MWRVETAAVAVDSNDYFRPDAAVSKRLLVTYQIKCKFDDL